MEVCYINIQLKNLNWCIYILNIIIIKYGMAFLKILSEHIWLSGRDWQTLFRTVFWPGKIQFFSFFHKNLYLGSFWRLLMIYKICLKNFENWIFPGHLKKAIFQLVVEKNYFFFKIGKFSIFKNFYFYT